MFLFHKAPENFKLQSEADQIFQVELIIVESYGLVVQRLSKLMG